MSVVYVAAMFLSILDTTIVNVALPTIGRDFAVSPTSVDTIAIAFLVSLAVFIPASGWLGDRFGGKRVLVSAIALFTAASAMCGAATSLRELVLFRVFQGIGGGMLAPVGLAMLYRVFPPEERVKVTSILIIPTTLAPALGPVLGGLIVTDLSWRWIFYVNLPIGLAALIFGVLFVDHSVEVRPGHFDLPGFLLSGVGLAALMYGISEGPSLGWSSAGVLATVATGAVLLATMITVELRTAEPIVKLQLFGNRLFRSANEVIVATSVAFLGVQFIIILYFQDGRGLTPLRSGLSSFPGALGAMAGAQLASRALYPRLGPRRLITFGLLLMAAAISMMASLGAATSLWWARGFMFGMGFGLGMVLVSSQAASFATITPADTGRAASLFNTLRQLGGAIGVALFTTSVVLVGPTHRIKGHVVPNFTAYRTTFVVAAATCLLGVMAGQAIRDEDAAQTIVSRRRGPTPLQSEAALPPIDA